MATGTMANVCRIVAVPSACHNTPCRISQTDCKHQLTFEAKKVRSFSVGRVIRFSWPTVEIGEVGREDFRGLSC